jgi:predicted O-methyltransferase YrrM
MLDKLRHAPPVEYVRKSLRGKAVRAVDDAVRRHYDEQSEQLRALRKEVAGLRTEMRREANRILEFSRQVEVRDRRDIFAAWEREAVAQSAEFVRKHMSEVRSFKQPHATLEHGLSLAPSGGLALEFGVFTGTTLKIIAAARADERVYGFDSFDGLPEHWRAGFPQGAFDTDSLPDVPGAELVVGLFGDVLPGFLAEHDGPVDFVHIDSDLYSSAKTVLDLVGPRLRAGSVLVFDEYFNYPDWTEHEYRAWSEYVSSTGTRFTYEGYTLDNEQVIVRISAP